jgi:2-polyprenyl-3-methyl-5-hydroxy-6-metoxy-1,4-benzoquinol methylase
MTELLNHPDGIVYIKDIGSGKRKVVVEMKNKNAFIPKRQCVTSYPLYIVEKILISKGPAWLCDEIMRDEYSTEMSIDLKYAVLSYLPQNKFDSKIALDFGCGAGASSMALARMFPNMKIIGIDLNEKQIEIAKLRANFYKYKNLAFLPSVDEQTLPDGLSSFDFIFLSAVYEHLLPNERLFLLPKLWSYLKVDGVLFINQTPNSFFPIELHTTGLPFINFLPDKSAYYMATTFSKRIDKNDSWDKLLRKGIRGAKISEIIKVLKDPVFTPLLLKPNRLGIKKQAEIWFRVCENRLYEKYKGGKKKIILAIIKSIKLINIPLAPYISIAIKKQKLK